MRSDISGFRKLSINERIEIIRKLSDLTEDEIKALKDKDLGLNLANRMIENVIGTSELPFGLALNFLINGKDYIIPMVLEEPSVVAAASYAAKLARPSGGFKASADEPVMMGQIQLMGVKDFDVAERKIRENREKIIQLCNERDSVLVKFGGGVKDMEVKKLKSEVGDICLVNLLVDVRDAMGANAVNTMCEAVSPYMEELTGGYARLRIISNLATKRLARAKAVWPKKALEESTKGKMKGEEVIQAILEAYALACVDQYRATTHNKGAMNGIDAVVIATGNDFRAVEAGAHSYAAITGKYKPLTKYYKNENGDLAGEIELPIAVGVVGGATGTKPTAKIALKILGVKTSKELACILASVGLAQNFAALRALATEGIQKGHMGLHARNIAIMAGASKDQIDKVAEKMIEQGEISVSKAKEILETTK